jgi:cobalamin biosynthesis protein CobT
LGNRNWARVARKKLASALGSVFFDSEDGYESGHSTGRLNIGDYIGSRGHHLDVFDRWVANADEVTSFEVVVLLDTSGSMAGSRMRNAAASAWAIERALADNDIPTTLISFNTRAALMKSSSESFSETSVPEWDANGGTSIDGAIRWANEIFGRSDKTHKVLLTLTDGAFYVEAEEMKRLNAVASSILIRIGEIYEHFASADHGHTETVTFDTEDDLRKMPDVLGAKILETTRNVMVSA